MNMQTISSNNGNFYSFYFDNCGEKIFHSIDDNPAQIINGNKYWYHHGKLHRDNDKPAIESHNGSKIWCQNGVFHRDDDKPAYISDNIIEYRINGLLHRDGRLPAVIDLRYKIFEFYKHGIYIKQMSSDEYNALIPEFQFNVEDVNIINYVQMNNSISETYDMDAM